MITSNEKSTITINGKTYTVDGNNVSIIDNKILVDGKVIEGSLSGIVKIEWNGPAANIDAVSIHINGNVNGNVDGTSIQINGDVTGNVDGTSITCGKVLGNVDSLSVNGIFDI